MTRPIPIPPAEYWQFRALRSEVAVLELEAMRAAAEIRQRIAAAEAATRTVFERMGAAHGFDPTKTYGWNDETCELIPKE
jgi:hypothetical protein